MTVTTELRELRTKTIAQAKALLDNAADEKRDLSRAENSQYEQLRSNIESISARIEDVEEREQQSRDQEEAMARLLGPNHGARNSSDAEIVTGLRNMLLRNDPAPLLARDASPRSNYSPGVEKRDLLKTAPANFTPISFYGQIVQSMVDSSAVLAAGATVITTNTGEPFRIPRATAMSTASITAEAAVITESDPTLSVVELGAYKYGVIVQVSREIIEDSGADLQAYLAQMTGRSLGLAVGNHLINGTGTGQPTGVLTTATTGVTAPTGCATSLGAQGTAGQGTDLLNNLYASVAEPYTHSKAAGFLLRGATLAAVRNLKTTTGDLVGNSYLANAPAPFFADPYVPAMAANAKSVLFGDWSRYFVRIVNGVKFERSDDFAFTSDLVTFKATIRLDAALVDPSAIKVLVNSAT
jgi:HK97 family phage major capsid protein